MVATGHEGERVADEKADERAHGSDADSLPKKNRSNLLAACAHGPQHGDVARFVGNRHGKNHQNVETSDESNQTDEDRRHQLFQPQRSEQRAILFHPRCR